MSNHYTKHVVLILKVLLGGILFLIFMNSNICYVAAFFLIIDTPVQEVAVVVKTGLRYRQEGSVAGNEIRMIKKHLTHLIMVNSPTIRRRAFKHKHNF